MDAKSVQRQGALMTSWVLSAIKMTTGQPTEQRLQFRIFRVLRTACIKWTHKGEAPSECPLSLMINLQTTKHISITSGSVHATIHLVLR